MVGGLAKPASVRLSEVNRMADFCYWGEAVCQHLGHPMGTFMDLYSAKRDEASLAILEDIPIPAALFESGRLSGGQT